MVFPDLPGCTAMGRTLDEALRHAMEAAAEWAQAVPAPRPRLLEALRDDPDVKAALADGDGDSRVHGFWPEAPRCQDDWRCRLFSTVRGPPRE